MRIKGLADYEKAQNIQTNMVAIGMAAWPNKIKRSALLIESQRDQSYFSKVAEINSDGDLSGEDSSSGDEIGPEDNSDDPNNTNDTTMNSESRNAF